MASTQHLTSQVSLVSLSLLGLRALLSPLSLSGLRVLILGVREPWA